jgi:hypothetical protein
MRLVPSRQTPNHRERQFMQLLRGRGCVKANRLPNAPRTILKLLQKCWIERQDEDGYVAYRITELGMAAKTSPIPK